MAEELRRLRIKRTEQLEREGRKPIGFYKKGGKTKPITKPKKTRVVKKKVTRSPSPRRLSRSSPSLSPPPRFNPQQVQFLIGDGLGPARARSGFGLAPTFKFS